MCVETHGTHAELYTLTLDRTSPLANKALFAVIRASSSVVAASDILVSVALIANGTDRLPDLKSPLSLEASVGSSTSRSCSHSSLACAADTDTFNSSHVTHTSQPNSTLTHTDAQSITLQQHIRTLHAPARLYAAPLGPWRPAQATRIVSNDHVTHTLQTLAKASASSATGNVQRLISRRLCSLCYRTVTRNDPS